MKKKQKTLLLGLGALVALYFFTRPKATTTANKPSPKAPPASAVQPTYKSSAALGSPYRDATV